jgi:outer membrane protein W
MKSRPLLAIALLSCIGAMASRAETDPFQDDHDFYDVSDEKSDEAFFHLDRFFQVEVMGGIGLFTGGLGATHAVGGAVGFNFNYFLDNAFAVETGMWFSFQDNEVDGTLGTGTTITEVSTTYLFVPNIGIRYYFNTAPLSRTLAKFNPYLGVGIDWVIRRQTFHSSTIGRANTAKSESNFGFNGGLGVAALVYGRSLYLGMDMRFHYLFFEGEADDTTGFSRAGDYFTILATLTYDY